MYVFIFTFLENNFILLESNNFVFYSKMIERDFEDLKKCLKCNSVKINRQNDELQSNTLN